MTNQQDTALLPCPLCGGEADIARPGCKGSLIGAGCWGPGHIAYAVGETREEAIAAWNKRAEQAKPSASCEADEATVERVARAIYEAEPIPPGMATVFGYEAQKALNGPEWVVYAKARAAIAALSERGAVGEEVEYLNKVESFGASFSREDDSWHVYTMEAGRIEPDFCIVPGYETAKIDRVLGILRYARAAITALRANAPEAQRYRHKKRGTEYDVLGFAEFQSNEYYEPAEGEFLVVYRGDDGKLWARGKSEFYDGRFEPLASGAGDDLGASGGKG